MSDLMTRLRRFNPQPAKGTRQRRGGRALLTTLLFGLIGALMLPASPASAEVFDTITTPGDGWDVTFHPTNQNYAFFAHHRNNVFGCFYRLDPDGAGPIEQGDGCFNNGAYTLNIGGYVGQRSSAWVTSDGNTAYIPMNYGNNGGSAIAKVNISNPDPTQWTVGTAVNFTTNMNYFSNSVMVNDVLWAVSTSGILKYDTTTQQASTLAKTMWTRATIYHAGGKIWSIANNLSLVCVDPSNGQFCSTGSFTNGAGASLAGGTGSIAHMAEYRNTDGSFGGFCSNSTCVNADGATDNSMVSPGNPAGSVGSWDAYGWFRVSDQHLLIRHQPLSNTQIYSCWDYTTQAACAGSKFTPSYNNTFPGKAYTVTQDAWNSNCFWTNADNRIIGAWDVDHTGGFATSGGECDLSAVTTTVTLTYDPQGGTGEPADQTGDAESDVTVSTTEPTRDGYTFTGWNTQADGSGDDYAGGDTYTLPTSGTDTLYAQWQINTVTLTYDPQGGTGEPADQTGDAASEVTVSTTEPTRDGHTFEGWNTQADGNGTSYSGGDTYMLPNSGTDTLYAQWTTVFTTPETVTLTYDPQGGTGEPADQTGDAASDVTVSTTEPTRDGYTFQGWNTQADGNGTPYSGGDTYTLPNSGTDTLYAQWQINTVTLTYDPQGGIGEPADQTGDAASDVTVSTTEPTRDGYRFTGWNTEADGSGDDCVGGDTYTLPNSGTDTLYAQWEPATTTTSGDGAPTPVPALPALLLLLTSLLLAALGIRRFV